MLIECEGSITIGMMPPSKTRNRPALSPIVSITNTAEEIIREAKVTLRAEEVAFTDRPKRYGRGAGRQLRYDLNIHGFDRLTILLTAILPYLRSKKRQAEIVMEFIESRKSGHPKSAYSEREWRMVTEVRKLNRRMPVQKAIDKALAYLNSDGGKQRSRTSEYYRRYVTMCSEIRSFIELTNPSA